MKFTHIPRARDQHKKRVAAYCRVSTLLEEQEDSLETQMSYYASFIEGHEDWEFSGVYSDEKSGTKAENRPGFQKLIQDALSGKVDYILVKSISRFSRNIVDCQRYARMLHGNGVDVHFEKENLDIFTTCYQKQCSGFVFNNRGYSSVDDIQILFILCQ